MSPRLGAVVSCLIMLAGAGVWATPAQAQEDARTRQLRLLCAQLSGDLTDPGGLAAFRRCLTQDPLNEIRRDNNIAAAPDRPNATAPAGFGRNTRRLQAEGVHHFEAASGLLYAIDKDGHLWRWTENAKDARMIDEHVAAFQIVSIYRFVQRTDGSLWRVRLDGSELSRIDLSVKAFHAIDASLVYVLAADGTLWRDSGDKRGEVDRNVTSFQGIDASLVYVLGADRQLWRETGTARSRTLVAKDIVAFQHVANGDATYVQVTDRTLWRKGADGKPEEVDRAVEAFRAVDGRLAYVLGRDGRLWQEQGGRDHAVLVDHDLLLSAGRGAFGVSDASHVYVIGNDYKMWAETMPATR